jgi:hypothetical protein
MRSLGTRRVAQAAGAATVAVLALAGCSAGQVAETALLKAPVSGLSTQSPDGMLLIRNLQVVYNSPTGYPANGAAPIELTLFNQSEQPMTVTITSKPAQAGAAGVVTAQQIVGPPNPGGTASTGAPSTDPSAPAADPSASTSDPSAPSSDPSAPAADPSAAVPPPADAGQPFRFTIQPLSSESFLPHGRGMVTSPDDVASTSTGLLAVGLSDKLAPGSSLSLVIQADTLTLPIEVQAPFGVPLAPVSRAPGVEGENSEE